ncbi:putative PhzA/B-like protein [Desulfosporosinus acididurans]|uniref:Putative PhzA/B-like protein n=1 Tax=Desulfosporosinus acididurans TaxID=476652 RepID=A0A0J1FLR5_9FIRM|nr:nuclear transport factor 2 family protein [Desulfosporosinus acididurans]KLU64464.1 putative PhzA/B-like protein [Desulfosporosinus acididurans]
MSNLQNPKSTASQPPSERHDFMGAAEVFEQVLEMYRTGNLQSLVDLLAEDAVMEFPFAPSGRPRRVEGKDNIIKYNQAILGSVTITSITDVEIHRMIDPDCVVVEMIGHGTVLSTGNSYERRYVDVCYTKSGRIQLLRDYWNPQDSQISKDNGVT